MSQKVLLLAVGILAGVAVAYFLPKALHSQATAPTEEVAVIPEAPAAPPVVEPPPPPPTPAPARVEVTPFAATVEPLPARSSAWARLAERYGPEKTALSSKITTNLASVINQGMELANVAARNSGSASIAEAASKEALRNTAGQLGLNDQQQQQASEIIQAAANKRLGAVNDLTSAMGAEPEHMMEMLLAGDALARKAITQDEYDRITQPTRSVLQNLTGLLTGRPDGGGASQLLDSETTAQLNTILTPDQQAKLTEITTAFAEQMQARQARRPNAGMPFQPGQIPIMELDKLDQSVGAMKQMAEAGRLMMEAMKGLKDANSGTGTR